MSWSEEEFYEPREGVRPAAEDDPKVQEIEPLLLALFEEEREAVYYETQVAILFERRFFHWVTGRALRALAEAGRLGSHLEQLPNGTRLRYYFHRSNRYWRRRATRIRSLVEEFSAPAVTSAVGETGEALVDAGLPRRGFLPMAENVKKWNGKIWTETNHDLDRVFTKDGIAYGLEIKNRLGYIDRDEFQIKLRMCQFFGIRPLFVARMMPETYMRDVRQADGFNWIMGRQFYPLGYEDLARRMEAELKLPTGAPRRLEDGTLERFHAWHRKHGGS
jgi:hypothetical protein